ncbi:MAG: DNA-processing protein DprA [Vicinamibacterales bacterium]
MPRRPRGVPGPIATLSRDDPGFPTALLPIARCPDTLFYQGDLDTLRLPAVAIVGSRAATAVGLETAARLAEGLAAHGVCVVSGLARGVDSAAHRGALRGGGRTIAVLGSGLDVIYPAEHTGLAGEIAAQGLVLSEYPPGTLPTAFHFPLRNRLISGLSRAVVVVEAHEQSGSLLTAGFALDQGREVMAVPGNVLSGRNRGGHALLRDGAKIVESADDIVWELGLAPRPAPDAPGGLSVSSSTICKDPVLRVMDVGHPYDLDALAAASGLEGARLLPRLLDLELQGAIRRAPGGRFLRSA